jgi:Holliday junction resolvase-like predicted endonuclease
LYYFEYRNKLELDFIIRYKDKVTAVEVKSAENTKAKSMTNIIQNWKVPQGIKLSSKNISGNEVVRNYPLYMAMFLK